MNSATSKGDDAATDPFLRALADAPKDGEPLSPEDEAAIQEGLDAIERREVISQDDLRRALGVEKGR
jgi:hypothetical protein